MQNQVAAQLDYQETPARTYLCVLILLCFSVSAVLLILSATKASVGIDADSVSYLEAARRINEGLGFCLGEPGGKQVITHWPPFYSTLLASLYFYGVDPLVGARWLGAVFMGANVLLAGAIVLIFTRGAFWAPVFAGALALVSQPILYVHAVAWSEPPFFFFGFLGLAAVAAHARRPHAPTLVLAILYVSLAFMTRYVGITIVAAGALSLYLWSPGRRRVRLSDSALFAVGSSLPMALWILRNHFYADSAAGRHIAYHPLTAYHVRQGVWTVTNWAFPKIPSTEPWRVALVGACIALALLVFAAVRRGREEGKNAALPVRGARLRRAQRRPERGRRGGADLSYVPRVMGLFALLYAMFILVSITFIDEFTLLNDRILLPVYFSGLIVIPCLVHRVLKGQEGWKRYVLVGLSVLAAVVLIDQNVKRTREWVESVREKGMGMEVLNFPGNRVAAWARTLPGNPLIYSNGGMALHFALGGFKLRQLPQKSPRPSGEIGLADAEFMRKMDELRREMAKHDAKIVYLERYAFREYIATEADLKKAMPLRKIAQAEDGAIYELDTSSGPSVQPGPKPADATRVDAAHDAVTEQH